MTDRRNVQLISTAAVTVYRSSDYESFTEFFEGESCEKVLKYPENTVHSGVYSSQEEYYLESCNAAMKFCGR